MDRVEKYKENEVVRILRRLINDEISKRILELDLRVKVLEGKELECNIEDCRETIETIISEYINYNVTIHIDA